METLLTQPAHNLGQTWMLDDDPYGDYATDEEDDEEEEFDGFEFEGEDIFDVEVEVNEPLDGELDLLIDDPLFEDEAEDEELDDEDDEDEDFEDIIGLEDDAEIDDEGYDIDEDDFDEDYDLYGDDDDEF